MTLFKSIFLGIGVFLLGFIVTCTLGSGNSEGAIAVAISFFASVFASCTLYIKNT